MTEHILTRDEVDLLDYKSCKAALKALHKAYNLDQPLREFGEDIWPLLDDIIHTFMYLEDRILNYEDLRNNMEIEE
jgi:hypothetical protein